jgi:hypothetical protein
MRQKNLITDVCLKVCRNGKEAPVNCMALAVSALSPSVLCLQNPAYLPPNYACRENSVSYLQEHCSLMEPCTTTEIIVCMQFN